MQRTSFANFKCPAARALDSVGDWWSMMILRDAFHGLTRFDEFQKSLGVAPNILTRRLAHLIDEGLFEKRLYSERPARYEYVLTEKGRDFFPVLMALFSWGRWHVPQEDLAFLLFANIGPLYIGTPGDTVFVAAGVLVTGVLLARIFERYDA